MGSTYYRLYRRRILRVLKKNTPPKSTYEVARSEALTYLTEIEKQEIEIRQTGFKHLATITLGALALSGGLLANSKSTLMFHILASLLYVIALILTLFAIWLVADQRRKRLHEILALVSKNEQPKINLPYRRIASPHSSRVLVLLVYMLFAGGALLTLTSFMLPKQCEWPGQKDWIERYACELVEVSKFITNDN